ncbi:MAG: extracellular elastinolytic metalloproteinase, partial [Gaiellaceae bacterium]|nr:extracellular elastinolytic metalloproteinase [Gaiellaceae bacterium]
MRIRLWLTLAALLALLVPGSASAVGNILDRPDLGGTFDARVGSIAPTAAQQSAADALGAKASWTRFGTVGSLIRFDGQPLAHLSGTPAQAARAFVSAHRLLFKLSDAGVAGLQVISDTKLNGSEAHAVLFRQRFGSLPAAQDGMITVGVLGGDVAYVSSSSAGDQSLAGGASLSPADAWNRAAQSVGAPASAVSGQKTSGSWTVFSAAGYAQPQRVRLVAFPTVSNGARQAYEVDVQNVGARDTLAWIVFVDAQTGAILMKQNAVDHFAAGTPQAFSGSFTPPTTCGPYHDFTVAAGSTTIDVVASATVPSNDIVLTLERPHGNVLASSDTATSPEAIHYAPSVLPAGVYSVKVCPFNPPTVPPAPPYTYAGSFLASDAPSNAASTPKWKFFRANPKLDYSSTDTRVLGCWDSQLSGVPVPGCQLELKNIAARAPWDYDPRTNAPTFTTKGNAANAAEAWISPLTPGEHYQPVSVTREYNFPWTNLWQTSKCSQASFGAPQRNDIDATVTNLFVMHNRMHDFSYYLGFTEDHWNLQDSNFGNQGQEHDPELGNTQAGAVNGGFPSYLGRDNANQITLQDGVPGITNQYLFQPIAAAFYSPCADGDMDASVVGHEYTHAISNRMVGGPDANLTGLQAGSMGESWSDLDAEEFLHAYNLVPTDNENSWAVGPYVTGNKTKGIRDYAIDQNPLNYSNVGFDTTGPEVHADGEIWNGVNYRIRQALIAKYNASYPATDVALQKRCADGQVPAQLCPGNRRWIQDVYNAFLLMQPGVSMLDARDAYLAADQLRFGGANRVELWRTFAKDGFGQFASSAGSDDTNPKPSFETPVETNEATITWNPVAIDAANAPIPKASLYVGQWEARSMPVADTDPATSLTNVTKLVPGTYSFIIKAPGHGLTRFSRTFTAGQTATVTLPLPTNWASATKGATATGDGINLGALIDDEEATNWAVVNRAPSVAGAKVTVKLAGGVHLIKSIGVSALLHPTYSGNPDTGSQSRFSALRQFEIWTCTASLANLNCASPLAFTKIYTSPADAFPGLAPRPVAPDLAFRKFDIPDTTASHVRLVVKTNQCIGTPAYAGEQDND